MNSQPVLDLELGKKKGEEEEGKEAEFEPLIAKPPPKKKPIQILCEDALPPHYTGKNLPTEIAESRNLAIKAMFAQGIASLTGLGFFMFRRVISLISFP